MPAKKTILTEAERAQRIREIARDRKASNSPAVLDRAIKKIAPPKRRGDK